MQNVKDIRDIKNTQIKKKSYFLDGLDCALCAEKINKKAGETGGVLKSNVSFISKELTVSFESESKADETEKKIMELIKTIEPHIKVTEKTINSTTAVPSHESNNDAKKAALRIALSIVFLALGITAEIFSDGNNVLFWSSLSLFAVSYICAGLEVIVTALKNITRGEIFDENFLMFVATAGAIVIGEFTEAAAVMIFFKIGETLQELAVNRSRKSIAALMNIRPEYANVKRSGVFVKVSPEEAGIGKVFEVKPGERIPLDGKIIKGSANIDTSMLTGESMPNSVSEGDRIYAGTVNLDGVIEAEAESEYGKSAVQKILELVGNAESKKSKTENFITRFAKVYTPVVVGIGIFIAAAVPLLFGLDFKEWIYRGLVFLIISCPCALVISIPLSYFGGIGKASKEGVLIKGSNYFEALDRAETVVFDKTGTLTKGSFKVTDIICPSDRFSENDILEAAAYAENYSSHPIAAAVREKYRETFNDGIYESEITDYSETAGEGTRAVVGKLEILAGNFRLLKRYGIDCPEMAQTHLHIALNGVYAGSITVSDELKETAAETIKMLKSRGIKKIVMLTGDEKKSAETAAFDLGIYADDVYSRLLPQDKFKILEELEAALPKGRTLVFMGDGINDAPVLARADIGAAMGGLGSDSAVEAADMVIMNDDPSKLLTAMDIAARTKAVVWQNIILALGAKFIIQVLSIFGLAGMWAAVFADVGVTVITVLNSLRLLKK